MGAAMLAQARPIECKCEARAEDGSEDGKAGLRDDVLSGSLMGEMGARWLAGRVGGARCSYLLRCHFFSGTHPAFNPTLRP